MQFDTTLTQCHPVSHVKQTVDNLSLKTSSDLNHRCFHINQVLCYLLHSRSLCRHATLLPDVQRTAVKQTRFSVSEESQ